MLRNADLSSSDGTCCAALACAAYSPADPGCHLASHELAAAHVLMFRVNDSSLRVLAVSLLYRELLR